jgi:hypothetical protein
MLFIKKSPNSHGFVNPHDIEQIWRDQFDWVYREYDYGLAGAPALLDTAFRGGPRPYGAKWTSAAAGVRSFQTLRNAGDRRGRGTEGRRGDLRWHVKLDRIGKAHQLVPADCRHVGRA